MSNVVNLPNNQPDSDAHHKDAIPIAGCMLDPSDNTLYYDQVSVRLEPRVVQVLLVLNQHLDEVVSREQLIAEVWRDRVVSDDALNRCISKLRKVFSHALAAPVSIETIAKSGYRLKMQGISTQDPISNRSSLLTCIASSIVVALCISALYMVYQAEPQWQRESVAVSPQRERYPSYNSNGELMVFARSMGPNQQRLMLQHQGQSNPTAITLGFAYDHQPSFSPNNSRIAFARLNQGQCHILVQPTTGGPESIVGSCNSQGVADLAWSTDGDDILFTSAPNLVQPGRLFRLNIDSGETQDVTPEAFASVDDFSLAKDGRIALSVPIAVGVEDIYIGYLQEPDSWHAITRDQLKIHGLAWDSKATRLFFSSNRGGPFELWQWQDHEITRVQAARPGIGAVATSGSQKIALEVWQQESQIIHQALGEQSLHIEVPEKAVTWDYHPAPNSNAKVMLSDRSGSAELWLQSDGEMRQLTQLQGPWIQSPRWASDGRFISFMVPEAEQYQLGLYNVKRNRVLQTGLAAFAPRWSPDGQYLIYGAQTEGQWRVWRLQRDQVVPEQLTQDDAKMGQLSQDSQHLFYLKPGRTGLWRATLNTANHRYEQATQILNDLAPVDWNNWHIGEQHIYYVNRSETQGPLLMRSDLQGQQVEVLQKLPELLYFSGLHIDEAKHKVYWTQLTRQDADIDVLRVKDDSLLAD